MSAARKRALSGGMAQDSEGLQQVAQPNLSHGHSILHSAKSIVSDILFLRGLHKTIAVLCCLPASLACYEGSALRKQDCQALAYAVCNPVTWIVWSLTGIIALLFSPRRHLLRRFFAFAGGALYIHPVSEFISELVLEALGWRSTMGHEKTQL
ncbi:hypothetical protein EKO27_g224 [Xylaria grammica]|uniref:Uncharacterized protein n=1 Tax=Xylaria grammica TaxID=363999 RepID=A0A439DKJ9_9PEZI|nr:hypothetical protein EKO27_g224 [Xylaria grammica]